MAEQITLFDDGAPAIIVRATPAAWKYARRAVPAWACERALSALSAFNERAGTRLSPFRYSGGPSDNLTRITGAVLDHPEVEDWATVVEAAFRRPWWKGPASVGVIFGPGVVDKNIALASQPEELMITTERLTSNGALLRAFG